MKANKSIISRTDFSTEQQNRVHYPVCFLQPFRYSKFPLEKFETEEKANNSTTEVVLKEDLINHPTIYKAPAAVW